MPLLKYTTQIDVEKTVGEIQKMLGKHGAAKSATIKKIQNWINKRKLEKYE